MRRNIFEFDPEAPNHFEEIRRANSGLPWCDICNSPAVFVQGVGWRHSNTYFPQGIQRGWDQTDHNVSTAEWYKTPSWEEDDFDEELEK